jgi:calcium-dependent protein kinase
VANFPLLLVYVCSSLYITYRSFISFSIFRCIFRCQQYRFEQEIWESVTPQAKQFIVSLLVTNPRGRPSAEAAQKSPWLQQWENSVLNSSSGRSLKPNAVQALICFKEYSDMRKLLYKVLSFTLLPDQTEDLLR